MMNVLVTKKLPSLHLDLLKSWGWNFDVVETLKITQVDVHEIPRGADAWIISSRNSLAALRKFIFQAHPVIFCIGGWIKEELESEGKEVRSYEDMKSLAADLLKQNFSEVLYFCGEEHRQELEEGLKNTNTQILKVITHQSEMIFPKLKTTFDVVFIFSPRSAESLLKHNSFSAQTIFACIGSTTSAYLNSRGFNNTFVPSYPNGKILLEEFHQQILNTKS